MTARERVPAADVPIDQFSALANDRHLHDSRADRKPVLFSGGDEKAAKPAALQQGIDGQHAQIGHLDARLALAFVRHQHTAHQRAVRLCEKERLRWVGNDCGERLGIGTLAAKQIRLMGPAALGAVTAIAALHQSVDPGDISGCRGANDRGHVKINFRREEGLYLESRESGVHHILRFLLKA